MLTGQWRQLPSPTVAPTSRPVSNQVVSGGHRPESRPIRATPPPRGHDAPSPPGRVPRVSAASGIATLREQGGAARAGRQRAGSGAFAQQSLVLSAVRGATPQSQRARGASSGSGSTRTCTRWSRARAPVPSVRAHLLGSRSALACTARASQPLQGRRRRCAACRHGWVGWKRRSREHACWPAVLLVPPVHPHPCFNFKREEKGSSKSMDGCAPEAVYRVPCLTVRELRFLRKVLASSRSQEMIKTSGTG